MTNARKTPAKAAEPKRKLDTTSPDAHAEASEQADEYDSIFAPLSIDLDDGTVLGIPLHPQYGMLDDEKLAEWDRLMFDVDNTYLREDDIFVPEQHVKDDAGNDLIVPATTHRGALRTPYQIMGEDGKPELVTPPHRVKIVQIALGELGYKRLKEGGRCAADVFEKWSRRSIEIRDRQAADSKSAGSAVDLAAVSTPDRE